MILYVNGDSHSVAAEAVNPAAFANDGHAYWDTPNRHGHRDNIAVSYSKKIADQLDCSWINQGESGGSNDRIIRTTDIFLETSDIKDLVLLIGWTTWEREEWLHNSVYYQISASGTDHVPLELRNKYKQWVISREQQYANNELTWHKRIWDYHQKLNSLGIKHLFFNTYSYFGHVKLNSLPRYNWGNNYINPYDENSTYFHWLRDNGYKTVSEHSYHYGKDAHAAWANYLIPHIQGLQ
jgi:hypothetical protein